jgi:hypothetical protein
MVGIVVRMSDRCMVVMDTRQSIFMLLDRPYANFFAEDIWSQRSSEGDGSHEGCRYAFDGTET